MKYFSCSGLIPAGGAAESESRATRLTPKALREILRRGQITCRELDLSLNFTSPGWLPDDKLRALKLLPPACGACLSNMAVAPDGSVVPCQSWLGGENFGNILEKGWKDIWLSDACRKIRERAVKSDHVCLLGEEGEGR